MLGRRTVLMPVFMPQTTSQELARRSRVLVEDTRFRIAFGRRLLNPWWTLSGGSATVDGDQRGAGNERDAGAPTLSPLPTQFSEAQRSIMFQNFEALCGTPVAVACRMSNRRSRDVAMVLVGLLRGAGCLVP